MLFHTEEF